MKEEVTNTRNSSFELLRIIAMIMIVTWHLCVHGLQRYIDISELSQVNQFLFFLIKSTTLVAVNLYVFISGYFLSKKSSSTASKVFKLVLETFVFSIIIYLFLLVTGKINFSILFLTSSVFSISTGQYWFITVYVVMFVLSPYLNIVIKNISKINFLKFITILFFIDCIWQYIYVVESIGVNGGFSIFHFISLYFLAAYLGKYGFFIKDFNRNVYLIWFLILTIINTIASYTSSGSNSRIFIYNSPLVVISAFCLFMFFKKISFKSKTVNIISKYTLGVYLIHEHFLIRPILWRGLGIVENMLNGSKSLFAIKIIIYGFLIFGVCWLLAFSISNLFNLTFNYFSKIFKRKYSSIKIINTKSINLKN